MKSKKEIAPIVREKSPELSLEIIKKYICPQATDQEAYMFLQLCKAQSLNPFLQEAYLIKYGQENATIVTGKNTFTKRADRLPQYDGMKAGIIVMSNQQIVYREGAFVLEGEILLGGWAEVFRKDRSHSFRNEVSLKEYERKTKAGELMRPWREMPATMIRKVAIVQSLREAFPSEFAGLYSPEEMPIDTSTLPTYEYGKEPQHPTIVIPEGKPVIQPPQPKKAVESPKDTLSTSAQQKAIHSMASKAGFSDEGLFSQISEAFGKKIESTKELTVKEASDVISYLSALLMKMDDSRHHKPAKDKDENAQV